MVAEWFALGALNRKVGSSSHSVGMMFSHHLPSNNVMVTHLTSFLHRSTQLWWVPAGGQIPLTMSHPSAKGAGGTSGAHTHWLRDMVRRVSRLHTLAHCACLVKRILAWPGGAECSLGVKWLLLTPFTHV